MNGACTVQGLKVGDKIAEFGSVTAANFTDLRSIGDVVQHSVGVSPTPLYTELCNPLLATQSPVHILMVRQGESISFSLTPQRWAGQGLLGSVTTDNIYIKLQCLFLHRCVIIPS